MNNIIMGTQNAKSGHEKAEHNKDRGKKKKLCRQ